MMKTQGISLMTFTTDTHLGQEGMGEVSKYLQQEGMMHWGGIVAKREIGEGENPAHEGERAFTKYGTQRRYPYVT
eukprot:4250552-Pleurochrysis_carterae.AAC.2